MKMQSINAKKTSGNKLNFTINKGKTNKKVVQMNRKNMRY